ncbi:hypothetical protein M8J76_017141 [Diaphorina citri]|nr:hypothetical protein M8J75_008493 [Diaphorina citri]KAI5730761.1 hypothetical protein M8J76_017141 [Diaphorina citri]
MLSYRTLFSNVTSVIGMVHVKSLPGTPNYKGSVQKIIDEACSEAEIYNQTKVHGVIVENMHDVPYVLEAESGPEITANMTRLCAEIRKVLPPSVPVGVQILSGCNKAALATAQAAGLDFIRAESFVFGHMADEGLMNAQAGPLLRYRKQIGADNVLVFTDIKKKHSSHAITADVDITETAKAASFFLSDGLIITGNATGDPADVSQLTSVKNAVDLPILIGSGVTSDNVEHYMTADALIIGSHFKQGGRWQNPVDKEKVYKFMEKVNNLQQRG